MRDEVSTHQHGPDGGLPHQTVKPIAKRLDKIIDMGAGPAGGCSITAHVPWMKKHQKLIVESDLPSLQTRLALQQLILDKLGAAGYVYIGMDHFAKPDDEIVRAQQSKTLYRNFQGYTTHKNCDIYAFGASSISQTEDVFVQSVKKLSDYYRLVGEGDCRQSAACASRMRTSCGATPLPASCVT